MAVDARTARLLCLHRSNRLRQRKWRRWWWQVEPRHDGGHLFRDSNRNPNVGHCRDDRRHIDSELGGEKGGFLKPRRPLAFCGGMLRVNGSGRRSVCGCRVRFHSLRRTWGLRRRDGHRRGWEVAELASHRICKTQGRYAGLLLVEIEKLRNKTVNRTWCNVGEKMRCLLAATQRPIRLASKH